MKNSTKAGGALLTVPIYMASKKVQNPYPLEHIYIRSVYHQNNVAAIGRETIR